MKLTELAIKNKVVTFVFVSMAVIGGILAYINMSKAENPGFTIRTAAVFTILPGGSPERVERLVTDKIEKAVMEMPELDYVESTSKNSVSMVYVNIKNEYDELQPIWDKLRRKLDGVKDDMPSNIIGPNVNDEFGDVFGSIIGITGEGYSYKELKSMADEMKDDILRIESVAKVEILGVQEERIFIEYNNKKLSEIGLSPYQLQGLLSATNIVIPGGDVFVENEMMSLEPSGNFESVEDLKRTVISVPNTNQLFYLEDIAEIRRGYVEPVKRRMRVNNKPALALSISMKDGGNIITLGEKLEEKIEGFKERYPIGIDLETIAFQPKIVNNKVNSFAASLIQSIITVMIVLLLFLGLRTGVIVAMMVPVIICITFLIMSVFGVRIEQVSLAALIIALGMLVDNSIVVSESIMVKMENGMDRIKASVETASELVLPLLISSLTTCSAFLPIALAKSNVGEFCLSLFLVVSFTLLTSWLMAISVIPVLCVVFLKVEVQELGYNSIFYRSYRGILIQALKHKWISLVLLLGMFYLGMQMLGRVPFKFFPESDKPIMTVEVSLPGGTSLERTEEVMNNLDSYIAENLQVEPKQVKVPILQQLMAGGTLEKYEKDGVLTWGTFVGESAPRYELGITPKVPAPEIGYILVNVTSGEVISELIEKIETYAINKFPDIDITAKKMEVGVPVGTPIQVRVYGKNLEKLYAITESVKDKLREMEGTKNVTDDWGLKSKKLEVNINQVKARKAGLTSQDIAGSLYSMISGFEVSQYREEKDLIPIMLRSQEGQNLKLNEIETSKIYSLQNGKNVSLNQVADMALSWQPSVIFRRDRYRTITVESNLQPGYNAMDKIDELDLWLKEEQKKWGYGYSYEFGGEKESSEEAMGSITAQLPIAGMIILLLLVMQFNSLKKVGVIFSIVPFILVAVGAVLLLSGRSLGFMPFLGIIALMGITINTAIVLMDRINLEMEQGQALQDAIVESAQARFRPIALTTGTTICGLIPLWLAGGPLFSTMALAMIGGLAFIIVIVLGILPIMFSIFYNVNFKKYKYSEENKDSHF